MTHTPEPNEVTIFCPLCEADLPVWTDGVGGALPRVLHLPEGGHFMRWPGTPPENVPEAYR